MTEPNSQPPAHAISELVADPNFPNSAVGQTVDIRGYTGVVLEVVKNSIKVRSAEGNTVSYNFHALRRLYGPRLDGPATPLQQEPPECQAPPPQTKREVILEPNFQAPLVRIESLVRQPDFPRCALGVFVDLHGFAGVVVELVGHSMKIRSREGSTCSYNAEALRKIYRVPQ